MLVDITISLVAVTGFGLALWWTRIVSVANHAMSSTMDAVSTMMDRELDDDTKEVAVRRAGLRLIGSGFGIFWRFAIALLAAAAPIYLADAISIASRISVFELMLRWEYILVVSLLAIVVTEMIRRRYVDQASTDNSLYSAPDRFFHIIAFSGPSVLKAASWCEDRTLTRSVPHTAYRPVFITSLARAGTTAVLNALFGTGRIATHTYRDMPFVTAPVLWNRIAGGHSRGVERRERAHGDGLEIDLDSPEAFEEVLWKMFWPEKYGESVIDLWNPGDHKPAAEHFISHHMAKVVHARQTGERQELTYCSKNNANIARIPYLLDVFPECRIVVPLRRPECHAASLLRQHANFTKRQTDDEFVRRYMRDIGHFEFGLIHKPFGFTNFDPGRFDPSAGNYWLNYWVRTYETILAHADRCIFVLQDDLRDSPHATMMTLCDTLRLDPPPIDFDGYFRSEADRSPVDQYDQTLLSEAEDIYRELARYRLSR